MTILDDADFFEASPEFRALTMRMFDDYLKSLDPKCYWKGELVPWRPWSWLDEVNARATTRAIFGRTRTPPAAPSTPPREPPATT